MANRHVFAVEANDFGFEDMKRNWTECKGHTQHPCCIWRVRNWWSAYREKRSERYDVKNIGRDGISAICAVTVTYLHSILQSLFILARIARKQCWGSNKFLWLRVITVVWSLSEPKLYDFALSQLLSSILNHPCIILWVILSTDGRTCIEFFFFDISDWIIRIL